MTTNDASPGAGRLRVGREPLFAGGILLLLLLANLATADLFPVVWLDEALHVDPAVSLWKGDGLRSTAWAGQAASETWVGYTPLYAILLAGWMKVFGFSLLSVRGFGHLLGLLAVAAAWCGLRRHGLLRSPRLRLAFVVLAACGAGTSFSYRCGRPDALLFFLAAAGFLASSVRRRIPRNALLLVAGALLPIAGLQGAAWSALFGAILVAFAGKRALEPVVVLVAGCTLGLAGLYAVLERLGLWETFRSVTLAANGVGAGPLRDGLARLELFPHVAVEDPSVVLLLVLALVIVALSLRNGRQPSLAPALFGALVATLVPTALCAAGRYALYYAWMAWVPLVVGTLASVEALGPSHGFRRFSCALLSASAVVGLPFQLALGLADASARSHRRVEEVVAAGVPPGSVAYVDAAAYYAARPRASRLFLPSYNRKLTPSDLEDVDAVVLRSVDGFSWEQPHPAIASTFRPLAVPAPPASRWGAAFRLHWIYGDYASLRAWSRRPTASGAQGPGSGR